jgi:hypothetical protein
VPAFPLSAHPLVNGRKPAWWSRFGASLVVITAVPAAIMVVPDTMSYVVAGAVRDLRLPAEQAAGLVRAAGLALPALLPAVPLAAVLARRVPAALVLVAGLGMMLGGEMAEELAGRLPVLGPVPAIGLSRVLAGLGAGTVLPATLVLARRHDGPRGRALTALWAGMLAAALIAAMPLALYGIPAGGWRAALRPYPWFTALALGVAALFASLPARAGVPALRRAERTQLLLPLAPAAGFAFSPW